MPLKSKKYCSISTLKHLPLWIGLYSLLLLLFTFPLSLLLPILLLPVLLPPPLPPQCPLHPLPLPLSPPIFETGTLCVTLSVLELMEILLHLLLSIGIKGVHHHYWPAWINVCKSCEVKIKFSFRIFECVYSVFLSHFIGKQSYSFLLVLMSGSKPICCKCESGLCHIDNCPLSSTTVTSQR